LSATLIAAVFPPLLVGVNVTTIVQFPEAATVPPLSGQVLALVRAKLLAFAPVRVMLLTVRATLPVFDSVTVLGGLVVFTFCLLKVRLVGDRVAVEPTPVPDTPAVWGLLLALSVTVNVALREPVAAGVKVTLMVQVALAAKVEGLRGQLLDCPKSPGLVPVKPMPVMVSAAPLGFESVTALAVLVMPTLWLPKSGTGEGERLGGATPVPDTPAVWGLLLRCP